MTRPRLSDYVLGVALVLALLAGSSIVDVGMYSTIQHAAPRNAPSSAQSGAPQLATGTVEPVTAVATTVGGVPSPLLPEAATPSPSEPQPVAATSTPALDAVTRSGIGTHMGNAPVGPRYLALPIGPGHRVRLCGVAACVTVTSTDAGPDLAMQRAGRVADLSVELFERICGCPASRGLANVSWTVVPDQHPEDPPEHPDDKRMRIEDGGPG